MKSRVSKHPKNHDAEGNQNLNSNQSQAWVPKKEGNGNIHNIKSDVKPLKIRMKISQSKAWMLSEKKMMVISYQILIKFKKAT